MFFRNLGSCISHMCFTNVSIPYPCITHVFNNFSIPCITHVCVRNDCNAKNAFF